MEAVVHLSLLMELGNDVDFTLHVSGFAPHGDVS